MMINKRRLFRVGIKGFEKATMISYNQKVDHSILLVNVSGGGLSFISKEEFPISRFNKYLFLFEIDGEPFKVNGFIVRNSTKEEDLYINYGVRFEYLSAAEESELISALNKYQSKHHRFDNSED